MRLLIRYGSLLLIFFLSTLPLQAFYALETTDSTIYTNAAASNPDPYMTREFDLDDSGMLKVFTVAGNIDIIPSSSVQKVKVELYIDRGFAFWSNASNMDNFRINMLQRGDEIIASVERKNRDTGFFSSRMSFSFRVYVPETMSTELETLGGNIVLENVHGEQLIKTSGGNIKLRDVTGQLKAYTSGGNIDIIDAQGTIYAQTEGGNISLNRSSGEFRLRTKGGRIISERISGTMLARVGGGDIRADFIRVAEGIDLHTTAGDIQLAVPDYAGYELQLEGTKVLFSDQDKVRGKITSANIRGTYKDSGPPINLQSNAGTVSLKIK